MDIPQQATEIIKRWEGLCLSTYLCSAGVLTIGYGTTARAGVGIVPRMGMTITQPEAEWYLEKALVKFAAKVDPLITAPINDNERSAFLSLAYNIGPTGFANSSALRHFNNGDKARSAASILLWNKETKGGRKVVSQGLKNRRADERKLFLRPVTAKAAPKATAAPVGGWWATIAAFLAAWKGFK